MLRHLESKAKLLASNLKMEGEKLTGHVLLAVDNMMSAEW